LNIYSKIISRFAININSLTTQNMSQGLGIFADLKVIDCASFIAGPAAATILSDFGADVIKVEPPGTGDPHRFLYAMPPNPPAAKNYFWQLTNRNKRSLALDLKNPEAKAILIRLIGSADVFVVNFPPHVRKILGLTYEDISRVNPRIIYADISGYGEKGPEADKPGFDVTAYWARTGLMDSARNEGSPPAFPVSGIGDHATASTLYGAIVTGLYRREKTGTGCRVSTSLIAEGAWAAGGWIQAALDGAKCSGATDDRENPHNALANTYRTEDDRWLILALVQEVKDWPGLVNALQRPELLSDTRFKDPKTRKVNAVALMQILQETFLTKPIAYWREILDKVNVTFGVVQTIEEIAQDQQLILNGVIRPISDSIGNSSTHTIDSPLRVQGEDKVLPRLAPGLGQHSNEILSALGYAETEIESFRANGVVVQAAAKDQQVSNV
jgi:crotonobetainyl-CoA:carnitine CoA-transferase CaiB-like acyl-CoA transferase